MVVSLTRESSTRSLSDMYECQLIGLTSTTREEEFSTPYPSRKRVRSKRVLINEDQNQHIPVLSLRDYTSQEHYSTFYSREEYIRMRQSIKYTIRFLKYRRVPPTSFPLDFNNENDLCIRGLECLADEYVNIHRKRSRKLSMAAVFECHNNMQHTSLTSKAEAVAQAYKVHTRRAQSIAGRWGYFDALDAGMIDETGGTIASDC
jgi:hypothetical protein